MLSVEGAEGGAVGLDRRVQVLGQRTGNSGEKSIFLGVWRDWGSGNVSGLSCGKRFVEGGGEEVRLR